MTLIKAMWDQNTHLALEFRAINKAHGMENNTNMESSGWGTVEVNQRKHSQHIY